MPTVAEMVARPKKTLPFRQSERTTPKVAVEVVPRDARSRDEIFITLRAIKA